MDNATRAAERTIAVLSPAFTGVAVRACGMGGGFRADPEGEERRLIAVRSLVGAAPGLAVNHQRTRRGERGAGRADDS
jgi:hypothetical protein